MRTLEEILPRARDQFSYCGLCNDDPKCISLRRELEEWEAKLAGPAWELPYSLSDTSMLLAEVRRLLGREEPNELTAKTIRDARDGKDVIECKDAEDMFRKLSIDQSPAFQAKWAVVFDHNVHLFDKERDMIMWARNCDGTELTYAPHEIHHHRAELAAEQPTAGKGEETYRELLGAAQEALDRWGDYAPPSQSKAYKAMVRIRVAIESARAELGEEA